VFGISDKYEMSKEDGALRYSLEIYEFNKKDRGEYAVTVTNALSSATSKCIVNMQGKIEF
jgi:hypothetical protein